MNEVLDLSEAEIPVTSLNYPECTYPRCREEGNKCERCFDNGFAAAQTPTAFQPTDDDVESLTICVLAAERDISFTEATEHYDCCNESVRNSRKRVALACFEHAGYLPSIVAAAAQAPVELYRADERRIDALEADLRGVRDYCEVIEKRDAAKNARITALEAERVLLVAQQAEDVVELHKMLLARDTRIAQLVAFTAANVPMPKPEPKAFPAAALRPNAGDPRRIGGAINAR